MDSFATPHNIIAAQSKEGKGGTKGGRGIASSFLYFTPLEHLRPAATFLATCVARREQRAR